MKAGTRLVEDKSWHRRKKFRPCFRFMICLHNACGKPSKRKIVQCNLAIVNCTINRRNRRASNSLSPVLVHFLEPHGKLYLRLQVCVPENESVHLLATPPPRTLASSINIPDALFPGADGANGHPKEPAQEYYRGLALRQIGAG